MEPEYKLKITPAAEEDLDEIYLYISKTLNAPIASQKLRAKIKNRFLSLRDNPYQCELSRNDFLAKKGYRRAVVDNYVGLYLTDEIKKTVIVARIFYGAMDYEKYI
ncbi:MAG: type II toxin-antitoxin system RelE/ParE family toxin [Oscillospiraceae bacterium]|nr:type II toxin-antitoxin system RelE/ParE family toxin [Oscillospiraceae bacterium]